MLSYSYLLVLAALPWSYACNGGDIMFVVDRSESVGDDHYARLKSFLQDVAKQFEFGSDKHQLALETFSDDVKVEFHLNQFYSQAEISTAIGQLTYYHPGATNTGKALATVRDQLLLSSNGARTTAKKVVVVVTDGIASVGPDPIPIAEELRSQGNIIVAIGVGPQILTSDLSRLAGATGAVYSFNDFDHLNLNFVTFVKNAVC